MKYSKDYLVLVRERSISENASAVVLDKNSSTRVSNETNGNKNLELLRRTLSIGGLSQAR